VCSVVHVLHVCLCIAATHACHQHYNIADATSEATCDIHISVCSGVYVQCQSKRLRCTGTNALSATDQ
jgi:hypothetical protein